MGAVVTGSLIFPTSDSPSLNYFDYKQLLSDSIVPPGYGNYNKLPVDIPISDQQDEFGSASSDGSLLQVADISTHGVVTIREEPGPANSINQFIGHVYTLESSAFARFSSFTNRTNTLKDTGADVVAQLQGSTLTIRVPAYNRPQGDTPPQYEFSVQLLLVSCGTHNGTWVL